MQQHGSKDFTHCMIPKVNLGVGEMRFMFCDL